jgi:hypothetical protein
MPSSNALLRGNLSAQPRRCRWTTFYVGRKVVGTANARTAVRAYITAFFVLTIDRQTLLDADAMPGNDLEDNILIAAAVAASLDGIVTRNAADFAHCPIRVWEPIEFLRQLAASGPSGSAGPTPSNPPP